MCVKFSLQVCLSKQISPICFCIQKLLKVWKRNHDRGLRVKNKISLQSLLILRFSEIIVATTTLVITLLNGTKRSRLFLSFATSLHMVMVTYNIIRFLQVASLLFHFIISVFRTKFPKSGAGL